MKKIVCIILCCFLLCSCKGEENVFVEQDNNNYIETYDRPSLLDGYDVTYNEEYNPNLSDYTVAADFSNVINPELANELDSDARNKLASNLFVVDEKVGGMHDCVYDADYEFFSIYNDNSSDGGQIPSFVTVDSLMHGFHLLYEYLQKQTEKNFLIDKVHDMSLELLNNSIEQLNILKGTEWESAAQRNVDYFSVAVYLCGDTNNYISNRHVEDELQYIYDCSGIHESPIFTTEERIYDQDYSQFEVRGYYTETENLKRYFKVMQWFGQMTFTQTSNELNKSALLINLALKDSALEKFECVYEITSFFAGDSDDNTYYEYYPIIEFFFGDDVNVDTIINKNDEYSGYIEYISKLPKPKINSMIVMHNTENEEEVTNGFRLIGQRSSIDGIIMENLTYKEVEENERGETRNLPSSLDVPAALGSDTALDILTTTTNVNNWPTYMSQMEILRGKASEEKIDNYNSSISSAWLGALTTLLSEKSSGWPSFMQGNLWSKKTLMSFLGSYTELKHDLVLYQKQPENGRGCGGGGEKKDDRGYVEIEPNLYHRMSSVIEATMNGLNSYGIISSSDYTELEKLKYACDTFESIAVKELNGVLPSDAEFDYIRDYGKLLSELWKINAYDKAGKEYNEQVDVMDYPNYLVIDIATDYDSQQCLEIAEGKPMTIYVVVNFDGELRIARGTTYSYREFTMPISNRLTDDIWKNIVKTNDRSIVPPLPTWYEDVYAKDVNMKGTKWLGSNNLLNNASSNLLTILTEINIRNYPSTKTGKKMGITEKGQQIEYTAYCYNEGYIWFQIGWDQWIASDGTWIKQHGKLDEDREVKGHQIEIIDSDMNIYSNSQTRNRTDENVYCGDKLYAMHFIDDRNGEQATEYNQHWEQYQRGYIWYYIGPGMYIKDPDGSRVRIID